LVRKYQRRLPGFGDDVISMYACGMSACQIQSYLLELYGLQVSLDLIYTVTDEVLADVEQWRRRPLEAMIPIVYFDALRLKIRDEGTVKNKAVYLVLGIRADGRQEVPGFWIEQTEGAKFWLKVFSELKNRGLRDILITVVDGLRGFADAIESVYLAAQIQTCIVHLIRNSLNLASLKVHKPLAAALGDMALPGWFRTRLIDRRIEPEVAHQFLWIRRPLDAADGRQQSDRHRGVTPAIVSSLLTDTGTALQHVSPVNFD
jgi:putative transposase